MAAKKPEKRRHKMPQRPQPHRREDISKREFERAIPDTWTYAPKGQREYGIDGVVEIFDRDDATGLSFNVQLKGVEKETANKALIKTTTRDYWKALDSPTLVVVVDGSGTIHYGWSHQFDVWGRKEDADSYQWVLPREWDDESAAEIEKEVRAARAALHLQSHLPIYWSIATNADLPAKWVASLQVSLERLLSGVSELTRREEQAGWATLEISIEPDTISVRLHGTPGGVIHYNEVTLDQLAVDAVAADIALSLAVEVERGGLDQLVADLIGLAIADSATLGVDLELTGFVATRVAKAGRADSAVALIERVYFDESVPFRQIVAIEIARDPGRLDSSAMTRIAETMAAHAPDAEDGPASEFYYNAGNMIRRFDTARAIELHDLAAKRHRDYLKRSYWWVEKGQMLFAAGDFQGAMDAYTEADKMGDEAAAPLLADTLAMTGAYDQAVAVWDRMQDISRFIWVVKLMALRALIDELGITSQVRQRDAAQALFESGAPGVDVLALDALHILGLWRAGVEHRNPDQEGFSTYYLATAAFAVNSPLFWFEALVAVQAEFVDPGDRRELENWVIITAVQECGDSFRHFLLEDDHVNEEAREGLVELVDKIELPETDGFVVRGDGQIIDWR